MKKTFFTVGKQIAQGRTYSNMHLSSNGREISPERITKLLNSFSNETRNKVTSDIMQTCYKTSIQEIKQYIQKGANLLNNKNRRDPLASLEAFEKSVEIALMI
jgi:hypothetical protein